MLSSALVLLISAAASATATSKADRPGRGLKRPAASPMPIGGREAARARQERRS
jgi:hypothetical protein